MICNNCGHELDDKDTKCSACGLSVEEAKKIKITYEDEETELVDPPVITEAHTFIDEESFAKKLDKMNQSKSKDQSQEKQPKSPIVGIMVLIIIIVLGLVGYYVVYPNINKQEVTKENDNKTFSSDKWTSGECTIDGVLYQLEEPYLELYKNHWNFADSETLEMSLDSHEITDDYSLTNTFTKSILKVRLKNPNKKETTMKESIIWSIQLDLQENEVDFELPGNIHKGSTEEEIHTKYGELSEENVIRDDENKTTTYHYSQDNKIDLDLTIYDDGGLKAFHYYKPKDE